MKDVIARAYNKSKDQVGLPKEQMVNYVKEIYAPFTNEEIAAKMVELLTPKGTQAKVEIVYQTLEGLHEACPNHTGDWYFSGDYPTPGGVKLVNQAFIDYIEKSISILKNNIQDRLDEKCNIDPRRRGAVSRASRSVMRSR